MKCDSHVTMNRTLLRRARHASRKRNTAVKRRAQTLFNDQRAIGVGRGSDPPHGMRTEAISHASFTTGRQTAGDGPFCQPATGPGAPARVERLNGTMAATAANGRNGVP